MIQIATKSKGALDRDSVLTINQTRSQNAFTAQNITALNQPSSYTGLYASGGSYSADGQRHSSAWQHQNGSYSADGQRHSSAWQSQNSSYSAGRQRHSSADRQSQNSSYSASGQTAGSAPASRQTGQTAVPAPASRQTGQTAVPAPAARQSHGSAPASRQTPQTAIPAPAPPVQHKMPALRKPVQKGQKAPLCTGNAFVLKACFGWNTLNPQCDADVSAFLLGADGKVPGDSWFVFYGQTESPDKSCRFQAASSADRESITIDIGKLNPDVKKIVFVLTIHEAFAKRLHFGMMKDAYIRILDKNNTEIVSFQIPEYYSNVISMMIGEIYLYKDSWKFNAVGNGVSKDLAGLCALYGVEVSD